MAAQAEGASMAVTELAIDAELWLICEMILIIVNERLGGNHEYQVDSGRHRRRRSPRRHLGCLRDRKGRSLGA